MLAQVLAAIHAALDHIISLGKTEVIKLEGEALTLVAQLLAQYSPSPTVAALGTSLVATGDTAGHANAVQALPAVDLAAAQVAKAIIPVPQEVQAQVDGINANIPPAKDVPASTLTPSPFAAFVPKAGETVAPAVTHS
jgi:hypothetical protein